MPGGAAGAAGPGGGAPGTAVARLHQARRGAAGWLLGSPGPRPRSGGVALQWCSGLETATGPSTAEGILTPCYRPGENSASDCGWGGALSGWRQEVMLLPLPECGSNGRDDQGSWSCTDAAWGRWIRHFSLYWQIFYYVWRSVNRLTAFFFGVNANKAAISVGGVHVMIFPKFRVKHSVCSLIVKITRVFFFLKDLVIP